MKIFYWQKKKLTHFLYFWKAHKNQMCLAWLEIRIFFWLALVGQYFFWFDNVIFAWIKVAYVQSQFSPTPLEVLTQFQDWELDQSVSFKIAQKFCAIFCAIIWKLQNSGDLPNFGSWWQLCSSSATFSSSTGSHHQEPHLWHLYFNNSLLLSSPSPSSALAFW